MYIKCKSCNKEFDNLMNGVSYSSKHLGLLGFCSDQCRKDYLNAPGNNFNPQKPEST